MPADNRALARASRFAADVLIVESEHDDVIPHPVIANYVDAFRGAASLTHEVMRGADHALGERRARARYTALLARWFRRRRDAAR